MDKWSRESTEILIEAYREHRALYDVRSPDYHDWLLKSMAMENINATIY